MNATFSGPVLYDGVRPGHAFILAIVAGLIAAFAGAMLWMGVAVMTGMRVGYVALAVGAFVGFTVQATGKGSTPIYGILGAVLTLLGCLGGEFLAAIQMQTNSHADFFVVLKNVNLSELATDLATTTSPMMYVIYAVGIFTGYRLSLRKV